jgi:hypothetical protein
MIIMIILIILMIIVNIDVGFPLAPIKLSFLSPRPRPRTGIRSCLSRGPSWSWDQGNQGTKEDGKSVGKLGGNLAKKPQNMD